MAQTTSHAEGIFDLLIATFSSSASPTALADLEAHKARSKVSEEDWAAVMSYAAQVSSFARKVGRELIPMMEGALQLEQLLVLLLVATRGADSISTQSSLSEGPSSSRASPLPPLKPSSPPRSVAPSLSLSGLLCISLPLLPRSSSNPRCEPGPRRYLRPHPRRPPHDRQALERSPLRLLPLEPCSHRRRSRRSTSSLRQGWHLDSQHAVRPALSLFFLLELTPLLSLSKHSSTALTLHIASASSLPATFPASLESALGFTVKLVGGDYSASLALVNASLSEAAKYAGDANRRGMLEDYKESFEHGDVDLHKEGSGKWVKDVGPVVESYIG